MSVPAAALTLCPVWVPLVELEHGRRVCLYSYGERRSDARDARILGLGYCQGEIC